MLISLYKKKTFFRKFTVAVSLKSNSNYTPTHNTLTGPANVATMNLVYVDWLVKTLLTCV